MSCTNYARWIPVHLKDMLAPRENAPEVASKFRESMFVDYKTTRRFSSIAIDYAHDQNNVMVKADGGAVGLTENPVALRR